MAGLADLGALNKSSSRVAKLAVKLIGGRVSQYTYTSKRDGIEVTSNKFEVWLVGSKPESYCIGYAKGSPKYVAKHGTSSKMIRSGPCRGWS